MNKKSKIFITIIVALIILGFWAFKMSSSITHGIKPVTDDGNGDNASVEELVITETRDGQKFWETYATSGQYNGDESGAQLADIKGNFYKNNKVVLSFDAPSAMYIAKSKGIKLFGGARAATENGILITANEFNWTGNKDVINAVGNVKIRKADQFLVASDHAVFSTDFKKIKVIGNSKTNVYKKN